MNYQSTLQTRRSIYHLSKNNFPLSDEQLKEVLAQVVLHTPSAFNMQTTRTVLLLHEEHEKFWNIVMETLRKRVPVDRFASTERKITGFRQAYGTLLFFEEMEQVQQTAKENPKYAENFESWSIQGNAMVQINAWNLLASEQIGASLQHYNPIVDEEVKATWNLPESWKLIAQMPFGTIESPADEKEFEPLLTRYFVFE